MGSHPFLIFLKMKLSVLWKIGSFFILAGDGLLLGSIDLRYSCAFLLGAGLSGILILTSLMIEKCEEEKKR